LDNVNNLDAIPVFVKVVEAGSFSAAARLLTTVSAKIAALEKRMCRWPAASLPMISRPSKRWPFSVKALPGYPTFSPPTLLIVGHRVRPLYAGVYGNFRPVRSSTTVSCWAG
jgi:hypothetical protein